MSKLKPRPVQRYKAFMTNWSTKTFQVSDVEPVFGSSTIVEGFRVTPVPRSGEEPYFLPLAEFISIMKVSDKGTLKLLTTLTRTNPFEGWEFESLPEKAMNDTFYKLIDSKTGAIAYAPIWRVTLTKVS